MLVPVLTFIVVTGIMLAGYWLLFVEAEPRANAALRRRLRAKGFGRSRALAILKKANQLSDVENIDRMLARARSPLGPIRRKLEISGANVTLGTVVLASVFLFTSVLVFVQWWRGNIWLALVFGLIASTLPYCYLSHLASKRMKQLEEQFPEAMDLIARALRAGHAFSTGISMAGEELREPIGTEFRMLYEQQNYGMPLADALRAFAQRVPLLDARFFVTAVLTQRESGSNLSEVLDKLSAVIRERFRVKRQMHVMSAHGRITGMVLTFLPPGVALMLFTISPDHMRLLIDDPLGLNMVIMALSLQVLGALIIRKILKFEY